MNIQIFYILLGVGRILIGLAPILVPKFSMKLIGFPEGHDNATARLMGRLFGVRDAGLGFLVFFAISTPLIMPFALLLNLAMDAIDIISIAISMPKKHGINKAAKVSMGFAVFAVIAWTVAYIWQANLG